MKNIGKNSTNISEIMVNLAMFSTQIYRNLRNKEGFIKRKQFLKKTIEEGGWVPDI